MIKDRFLVVFKNLFCVLIDLIGENGVTIILLSRTEPLKALGFSSKAGQGFLLIRDIDVLVDDMFMGYLKAQREKVTDGEAIVPGREFAVQFVGADMVLGKLV